MIVVACIGVLNTHITFPIPINSNCYYHILAPVNLQVISIVLAVIGYACALVPGTGCAACT